MWIDSRPAAAHRIADLRIEPSFADRRVRLRIETNATQPGKVTARLRYLGPQRDAFETPPVTTVLRGGSADILIPHGREARQWNEFTPPLYQAEVRLETETGTDTRTDTFGFRDAGVKGGRLAINGQPLFLRGTLECAIFPLTGHPPTDVDSWRRIIRICKEHGINHIRFHSWCPPEAAYVAADELGFYYRVEASSWANQGAELGSGRPLDPWIEKETQRMIRAYGNHPSFLMMASGNEPSGPNHKQWLQQYVARWKRAARRHNGLYPQARDLLMASGKLQTLGAKVQPFSNSWNIFVYPKKSESASTSASSSASCAPPCSPSSLALVSPRKPPSPLPTSANLYAARHRARPYPPMTAAEVAEASS